MQFRHASLQPLMQSVRAKKISMSEKDSHPLRNGVIATVVGGVILSAIPPVRDFVSKIFGWIWSVIVWIWEALVSSYSIPGWVLITVSLLAVIGVISIYIAVRPSKEPEYKKYTEDFIYGVKWRWSWLGDKISRLRCYCPVCDADLVHDDSSCKNRRSNVRKTDFICEHCGNQVIASIDGGNMDYAVGAVEREIYRKIRTNEHASAKS